MKYLAVPLALVAIAAIALSVVWLISRFRRSRNGRVRARYRWITIGVLVVSVGGLAFLLVHYGFPAY